MISTPALYNKLFVFPEWSLRVIKTAVRYYTFDRIKSKYCYLSYYYLGPLMTPKKTVKPTGKKVLNGS